MGLARPVQFSKAISSAVRSPNRANGLGRTCPDRSPAAKMMGTIGEFLAAFACLGERWGTSLDFLFLGGKECLRRGVLICARLGDTGGLTRRKGIQNNRKCGAQTRRDR